MYSHAGLIACGHLSLDTCLCVYEHMCVHAFSVHLFMHIHTNVSVQVWVCMYMQVCVNVCTYLFLASGDWFCQQTQNVL